ncbi:hypothetical protein [Archangium sp. Cb G35]|uniref:hypothetical protein n=1 Tax=Archangium sp. Cb G35 TaxID=1920190 RepID=UPI000937267E|nr:hypothetical protein [Archangium sp. Cb G35]
MNRKLLRSSLLLTALVLGGCPGAPEDEENPNNGEATLSGSLAFEVKAAQVVARTLPDGGPDYSRLAVVLTSVEVPCEELTSPGKGPGWGLVLEARNPTGAPAKGTIASTGTNIYRVQFNPDGGAALGIDWLEGSFTVGFDADPTAGATGTVDLSSTDGGTLQGSYTSTWCGTY